MTLSDLLNSDVSTLSRLARDALDWWLQELRSLLPTGSRGRSGPVIVIDADNAIRAEGAVPPRATVAIADDAFLERRISMPAMSANDIRQVVGLDSERYFPMPAGSIMVDAAIASRGAGDATMQVDLAALPLARAQLIAEAVAQAGIVPMQLVVARDGGGVDPRFDFAPLFRAEGLIAARDNRAARWWAVVAFLFVANVAVLIWRDQARVDQVQAMVDAQRPSVDAARRISARLRQGERLAANAGLRRRTHDVLGDLAAIGSALPADAWVQRYVWDARSLRLTGYVAARSDLVPALRRVPGVASVKSSDGETVAETGASQPFDVTLTYERR